MRTNLCSVQAPQSGEVLSGPKRNAATCSFSERFTWIKQNLAFLNQDLETVLSPPLATDLLSIRIRRKSIVL